MISKDLETKCSLSGGTSYSRFLVLEVSRRELVDEQVVAKYGRHLSEKVLRLFDEALSQEKFCSLREDWELSEVEPGDIVHITGLAFLCSDQAFLCRDLLSPKTGWCHFASYKTSKEAVWFVIWSYLV